MLRIISISVAVLTAAHAQSPEETKDGFLPLFNGKDFAGWRFGPTSVLTTEPKNWSVADGLLKLSGKGGPHIATQWDYDDFDVRIEWRAQKKGYNSGFYIRSGRNVGANQINLAENDCGHLMGGPKGAAAVPKLQKKPGEWNEWRVLAVGDKLTLWCNGDKAWELIGFKPARGYLGLQEEGAAIDFKNLRIKELGYQVLGSLADWKNPDGWKQEGDALLGDMNAKPLVRDKSPAQFTLRLECMGDAVIQLGGKTLLALGDTDVRGHANPLGQWNYLEIAVRTKGVSVIVNNNTFSRKIDGAAGALTIAPTGPVALRNLRIREIP